MVDVGCTFFQQPVNQYLFKALTALVLTIPLLPATASEEVIAPPAAPTSQPTTTVRERNALFATDESVDKFISDTLNTDMSNVIKDMPSLDGIQYDVVAGTQRSDADLQQANIDSQTMLMMQGQSVASSVEDSYNMGQFQPTLYGGDSMPFFNDLVQTGRNVRAGLGESLVQEQQRIIEKSFQPKREQDVVR